VTANKVSPIQAAKRIFATKYADAELLFLAGSVVRGEQTKASDLDIVVIYENLPNAYRESFTFQDWPVEAFVHDPETLNYFFNEVDGPSGYPSLMQMVLEGVEVPRPTKLSGALKQLAGDLIEAGPPKLSEEDLRRMRYRITDLVDDIRHPCSKGELIASGTLLYSELADFYFRSQNYWSAKGKTIPRRLKQVAPDFYKRFCGAFEALFVSGKHGPVITLAEEVLQPYGGFLFNDQRFDAPADFRKTIE
jgi:hypothetical protein